MEIKAKKEILKKIIDNNNDIPFRAKEDLKGIIDMGATPEEIFQGCIAYSIAYKS